MSAMSNEEINISLFDEVKKLKEENKELKEALKVKLFSDETTANAIKLAESRLKQYRELESQNETLTDTVNMLSPLIMECHDLKELNRELVNNLKCINENTTDKMVKAHTGALLERYKGVE